MNCTIGKRKLRDLGPDERGLTTVEYALLLAVIALAALTAFSGLGTAVSDQADVASQRLASGGGAGAGAPANAQ